MVKRKGKRLSLHVVSPRLRPALWELKHYRWTFGVPEAAQVRGSCSPGAPQDSSQKGCNAVAECGGGGWIQIGAGLLQTEDPGSKKQWHGTICSPLQERRAVLGWWTPQATCQARPHHWHTSALCQARVAGALSAGRDRAAGWGEDLLTGRETRDVALILAKFSASPRQGQGCSHRISASLSQKCWEPTEFEYLQWWVFLQHKVVTGQM